MKKLIDINLGGVNFAVEEDAYTDLRNYLAKFETTISNPEDVKEVMEDIELRIAEIFRLELKSPTQVVDKNMVSKVIECLGKINGTDNHADGSDNNQHTNNEQPQSLRKLYRDSDDEKLGGICSGLACYFNLDVTLVRAIFLASLLCYGSTFWLYIIMYFAVPKAVTVPQKLQMRGIPVTAENIKKYSAGFY